MVGSGSLFEDAGTGASAPLAERLRPRTLDEVVGQRHLVGEGGVLRRLISSDNIPSMIFWGPPGVGKTTLANVIAHTSHAQFITFSAVTSGIKEIKEVMAAADASRAYGGRTIVFVDEIHRFNKAQQDAFLPFVEKGSIVLIGATTENPSFEVNGALLSRSKVFVLKGLSEDDLATLLLRAVEDARGFGSLKVKIDRRFVDAIAAFSNGDARSALSTLEMVVLNSPQSGDETVVTEEIVRACTSRKALLYDKSGEEHYNTISALHKSMRNSDPDAAVYWLARMLESGEDPLYVARRVLRFASEDVGLADPHAVEIAVAAFQACHFIGMPECSVHLAQAVIYLSVAPKSNSADVAYMRAKKDVMERPDEPVPMAIRNAPTRLMKEVGYGKGYRYAHDEEDKIADLQCLPDSLAGREYYTPTAEGIEARIAARLEKIKEIKAAKRARAESRPDAQS
ncbi:MAG: replication-associated recombination protein A [Kiritimatiellae bacterium]|nr:replication-associated recombination protein A [Kiritimatiellia bacterium]